MHEGFGVSPLLTHMTLKLNKKAFGEFLETKFFF